MFCQNCGTQFEEGNNYCPKCGIPISIPSDSNSNLSSAENTKKYQEPGRGTLILVLGILSIILLGPFVGIPAWIMGNKDLKKIKNGIISLSERTTTKVGMILGIIGTFLSIFTFIIIGIAIVVGINIATTSAQSSNRDVVIADLNTIGSYAQQYYRKPTSMGGGGNTFTGWTIPPAIDTTGNGTYYAIIAAQTVTLVGTGFEKGNDGTTNVKATVTITPTNITTTINN